MLKTSITYIHYYINNPITIEATDVTPAIIATILYVLT